MAVFSRTGCVVQREEGRNVGEMNICVFGWEEGVKGVMYEGERGLLRIE